MTKVLLVEDDIDLRENTSLQLELSGYEVVEATDGQSALAILRTSDILPDIIVSDIAMPDMDGYKLLETIRSNNRWYSIPVLFATAFGSKNSIQLSRELGVDDYIVKPFMIDELLAAMENKLKRVKAFRDDAEQRLDDARRNLLHMMSHELRTPMTEIFGGTDLLSEHLAGSSDELVTSLTEIINVGTHRLNRLTNNALALIQIDSGYLSKTYMNSRRIFEISEIVRTAKGKIDTDIALHRKHVDVQIIEEDGVLFVGGVYEFLVTIFEEVLRNAVVFSQANQKVIVRIKQNDMFVTVGVKDSGPGIPSDRIQQVWKRFAQVNREEYEQQGTGLGLSIVNETVRIHRGFCKIHCPPSGGTIVEIHLPLQSPD